jgi:hypothetical protein
MRVREAVFVCRVIDVLSAVIELTKDLPDSLTVKEDLRKMSLAQLDVYTQADSAKVRSRLDALSKLDKHYGPYCKRYLTWVEANLDCVPALPVQPAVVMLFLQNEMGREHLKSGRGANAGEYIAGTSLGAQSFKQVSLSVQSNAHHQLMTAQTVNSLEWLRKGSEHLYPDCAAAQRPLRFDQRIRILERASKSTTSLRIAKAHALKAEGSAAASLRPPQIDALSLHWLGHGAASKPVTVQRSLRNRGMFLMTCGNGFRGDNAGATLVSDLYTDELPLMVAEQNVNLRCLVVHSNNSKTNKDGRIDESGFLRYREPLTCPINAICLSLWAHYHLRAQEGNLGFVPIHSTPLAAAVGPIGERPWYHQHLFYAKGRQ